MHIDHAGPISGKYLLVIVDAHSKWIQAHVVPSTAAGTTIAVLKSVFATHGIPEQLVSNNGSGFASGEFREFTVTNGINHTFTAPYHPTANGLAERSVQIIKKALKTHKGGGDMTQHISEFLMRYRIIPHSTTGISPSELLMGRRIRSTLDRVFPNVGQKIQQKQEVQKRKADIPRRCDFFKETKFMQETMVKERNGFKLK